MNSFKVPTRSEVSASNQQIFDQLEKGVGFVPNLYAYYAKNETALPDYLAFQNRKSTLTKKEKEVVNLVVSEYNGCEYCQSAHTTIAGLNGFTPDQILEIRGGSASFDARLDALAKFTLVTTKQKGQVSDQAKDAFFAAGFTEVNLIDIVLNIGDKIVSNYIHNLAQFEIDFPKAAPLELAIG